MGRAWGGRDVFVTRMPGASNRFSTRHKTASSYTFFSTASRTSFGRMLRIGSVGYRLIFGQFGVEIRDLCGKLARCPRVNVMSVFIYFDIGKDFLI